MELSGTDRVDRALSSHPQITQISQIKKLKSQEGTKAQKTSRCTEDAFQLVSFRGYLICEICGWICGRPVMRLVSPFAAN